MPAAAVIPAPGAYINVVAVKRPVVGFEGIAWRPTSGSVLPFRVDLALRSGGALLYAETEATSLFLRGQWRPSESSRSNGSPADVTVSKTECSRQPLVWLNVKAWNDKGSTA